MGQDGVPGIGDGSKKGNLDGSERTSGNLGNSLDWLEQSVRDAWVPTLHVNVEADERSRTRYPEDSGLLKIYRDAEPAVVRLDVRKEKVEDGRTVLKETSGTGFFVTKDGLLATDNHVVRDEKGITVVTADGKSYRARVETVDRAHDIALLRVESPDKEFATLPLADTAARGGAAVAVGHPRGWSETFLSPGAFRASNLLTDILPRIKTGLMDGEDKYRVIHTYEMHVEGGNSGGPIIGADGRVQGLVGLTNSKDTTFVTPVDDLIKLLNRTKGITAESVQLTGRPAAATTTTDGSVSEMLQRSRSNPLKPIEVPRVPSVGHTAINSVNAFTKLYGIGAGNVGLPGSLLSVGLGGYDLVTRDATDFKSALADGSTRKIIGSALELTADTLLIGGGLATMSRRFVVPGAIASALGSGVKIVADGVGYVKHFN